MFREEKNKTKRAAFFLFLNLHGFLLKTIVFHDIKITLIPLDTISFIGLNAFYKSNDLRKITETEVGIARAWVWLEEAGYHLATAFQCQ